MSVLLDSVATPLGFLGRFTRPKLLSVSEQDRQGFLESQRLALCAAHTVSGLICDGWTEKQAAGLVDTYLQDHGVRGFFHRAFAWFGERTRFAGIRNYAQFRPTDRVLLPGEVYILDVAPIVRGYSSDIGYTASLGPNARFERARSFLKKLHAQIPELVRHVEHPGALCEQVSKRIRASGYEVVHHRYPFEVLGHRVHRSFFGGADAGLLGFGWQSYWELLSRGLVGQLLNEKSRGTLEGLWAIEPHIGDSLGGFGAKFEQILEVKGTSVQWLDPEAWPHSQPLGGVGKP